MKDYLLSLFLISLIVGFVASTLGQNAIGNNNQASIKQDIPNSQGVDHVGLAVKDLEVTKLFFIDALGFKQVGEDVEYPAAFLSDGKIIITLWQVQDASKVVEFNRKNNIGLHHLAFKLNNLKELNAMYERLKDWPGVKIEFPPELLADGPTQHMMFYEPGGIRLEFIVRLPEE